MESAKTVEVLVYNVSHIDMVLGVEYQTKPEDTSLSSNSPPSTSSQRKRSLNTPTPCNREEELARAKFHVFNETSRKILQCLLETGGQYFDLYSTVERDNTNPVENESNDEEMNSSQRQINTDIKHNTSTVSTEADNIPVGFGLQNYPVSLENPKILQHRSARASDKADLKSAVKVVSVYFPLIAQTVSAWIHHITEEDVSSESSVKYVFLVTGSGKPRNRDLKPFCDSTENFAHVIEIFLERFYPNIKIVKVDSGIGIFQYDKNVKFVQGKLLPKIEEIRRPIASAVGENWQNSLRITLALTDGSPARMSALSASLRGYQPSYIHMWQLKTFWHEQRLLYSDLKFQSFETMETKPAMPVESLDIASRLLVTEMIKHKRNFEKISKEDGHELNTFWLRKTQKPVLAVLMVQRPEENSPKFFRGMNLEVSMPTGSLCSERNVVGTALASDQSYRRRDLRMIAILSMSLDKKEKHTDEDSLKKRKLSQLSSHSESHVGLNPISPCGACMEWLKKIAEVNPDFKIMTFSDTSCANVFVKEVYSQ